jgi:branched-chain amino acid transport system permease protein
MTGFLQHSFNGLVSGAFLALLALGLSVIFGMLRVVNFAHGAFYMLGAFGAYVLLTEAGIPFWGALVLVPLGLAGVGMALERAFVRRLARLDPLYNFLLTFGVALILQDLVKLRYGVQSSPYATPDALAGSLDLGLFDFPTYRVFVLLFAAAVCAAVWWLLGHTRVGMVVRAATERPELTRALGINVGRWVTPVFAVVVIGGLGSIFGSVAAGFGIGLVQAWAEAYLPPSLSILAQTSVFVVMAVVLLWRPAGLFGREEAPA